MVYRRMPKPTREVFNIAWLAPVVKVGRARINQEPYRFTSISGSHRRISNIRGLSPCFDHLPPVPLGEQFACLWMVKLRATRINTGDSDLCGERKINQSESHAISYMVAELAEPREIYHSYPNLSSYFL